VLSVRASIRYKIQKLRKKAFSALEAIGNDKASGDCLVNIFCFPLNLPGIMHDAVRLGGIFRKF